MSSAALSPSKNSHSSPLITLQKIGTRDKREGMQHAGRQSGRENKGDGRGEGFESKKH